MAPDDRCGWRNIDVLLDEETRLWYRQLPCPSATRTAFEDRTWFLSRTLYSAEGNDSRTEYYARKTMEMMLRDAPDVAPLADFRELVLRYGWPRSWTMFDVRTSPFGRPGAGLSISALGEGRGLGICRGCNGRGGSTSGRGDGSKERDQLLHYEPSPAFRFVPASAVLVTPASSTSIDWTAQDPPVPGRYAPPYARSLSALDHQEAMFKRGDSAIVVLGYNASEVQPLSGGMLTSALVLSAEGIPLASYGAMKHGAPMTGVLITQGPWGSLLMSAEVYAYDKNAVARARYGIAPPPSEDSRIALSDLLLFAPSGEAPASLEQAALRARTTTRFAATDALGVYWETYGTDSTGESMKVSLAVLKEVESSLLDRVARAVGLQREPTRVVVSMEDISARRANVTTRALDLDISTLSKGTYVIRLEVQVAGQHAVHAERRIEIVSP
jgi:hypothetical protein